jgi:ferredoxin-NADP reductase
VPPIRVRSNRVGRADDTAPNLGVVQNGNGLRTRTTQESHGFRRVECQFVCYEHPSEEDRQARNFDNEDLIDRAWLEEIITHKDADFYFCGPVPLMKTVKSALKEMGIPEERMHYEFFGSAMNI